MKTFKKLLLLSALVFLVVEGFSYPILSRSTSGGIFNMYSYTDQQLQAYAWDDNGNATKWGWVVSCSGYGFTGCPNRSSLACPATGRPDNIDLVQVGDLLDYADVQISNANPGDVGSKTVRVQVQGESFERDYTLTWQVNSDGSTSTTIDEKDVTL